MKNLKQLNSTVVDYLQEYYRQRLRTLQSVDELVERVASRVDELGISDNTYIVYTSDNGFHVGQHRMPPGKSTAYEDDINIPMIIRGPGVRTGVTKETVSTHTDLAPTLLQLAGIDAPIEFDGTPIPLHESSTAKKYEHVGVEFWGTWDSEGVYGETAKENTYKALRVIGDDYSLSYTVWCTHEHELYDLSKDPGQMLNLLGDKSHDGTIGVAGKRYSIDTVQSRLDALVQVLRTCNGTTCIQPWNKLHPEGHVKSLSDALSSKFDTFYEKEQVKMKFVDCKLGYLMENEGKGPVAFGAKSKREDIWTDTSMKYFDDDDEIEEEVSIHERDFEVIGEDGWAMES